MAVSKMSKVTLITTSEHQERLLQLLQELQNFEIQLTDEVGFDREWLTQYFPKRKKAEITFQNKQNATQINDAITFLNDYGSKAKGTKIKRQTMSLKTLENSIDLKETEVAVRTIEDLKDAWQFNQQQTQMYLELENWGTRWQSLDILPSMIPATLRLLNGSLESNSWDSFKSKIDQMATVYLEFIYEEKNEILFSCLFLQEELSYMTTLFQEYGVKTETISGERLPKDQLQDAKVHLERLAQERKSLSQQIGQQKQAIASLQLAEEICLAKHGRELVKEAIVEREDLVLLRGWLAVEDQSELTEKVSVNFNDTVFITYEEPLEAELKTNRIPTKLKNARLIRPFEMLTEMYSLPKYDEIDPTPWLTPFYFVFFGMMVADLGYGLLMLGVTTFGLQFLTFPKGTNRFLKLFQILSLPTIVWGGIYGSFFGLTLPFQLLSPSEDFMVIFAISMIFGGLQIFTGLFLAAKEHLRKRDYLGAISQGFSWQGILIGILIAAAGNLLFNSSALVSLGIGIAVFSGLLILFISVVTSNSKIGGFFSGVYDLYGVTGYIGDFVSYSRLMALGISGGSIAAAFNMLVGYMPPVARFSVGLILIVVLQGLNIFLSLLSAYVHAARLQYVEFFGKFFTGGGRAFRTFKPEEKYIDFEENGGNKHD